MFRKVTTLLLPLFCLFLTGLGVGVFSSSVYADPVRASYEELEKATEALARFQGNADLAEAKNNLGIIIWESSQEARLAPIGNLAESLTKDLLFRPEFEGDPWHEIKKTFRFLSIVAKALRISPVKMGELKDPLEEFAGGLLTYGGLSPADLSLQPVVDDLLGFAQALTEVREIGRSVQKVRFFVDNFKLYSVGIPGHGGTGLLERIKYAPSDEKYSKLTAESYVDGFEEVSAPVDGSTYRTDLWRKRNYGKLKKEKLEEGLRQDVVLYLEQALLGFSQLDVYGDRDAEGLLVNLKSRTKKRIQEIQEMGDSLDEREDVLRTLLNWKVKNQDATMSKIATEKFWAEEREARRTWAGKALVFTDRYRGQIEIGLAMTMTLLTQNPLVARYAFGLLGSSAIAKGIQHRDIESIVFGAALMMGFSSNLVVSQLSHAYINSAIALETIILTRECLNTGFTSFDSAQLGTNIVFIGAYARAVSMGYRSYGRSKTSKTTISRKNAVPNEAKKYDFFKDAQSDPVKKQVLEDFFLELRNECKFTEEQLNSPKIQGKVYEVMDRAHNTPGERLNLNYDHFMARDNLVDCVLETAPKEVTKARVKEIYQPLVQKGVLGNPEARIPKKFQSEVPERTRNNKYAMEAMGEFFTELKEMGIDVKNTEGKMDELIKTWVKDGAASGDYTAQQLVRVEDLVLFQRLAKEKLNVEIADQKMSDLFDRHVTESSIRNQREMQTEVERYRTNFSDAVKKVTKSDQIPSDLYDLFYKGTKDSRGVGTTKAEQYAAFKRALEKRLGKKLTDIEFFSIVKTHQAAFTEIVRNSPEWKQYKAIQDVHTFLDQPGNRGKASRAVEGFMIELVVKKKMPFDGEMKTVLREMIKNGVDGTTAAKLNDLWWAKEGDPGSVVKDVLSDYNDGKSVRGTNQQLVVFDGEMRVINYERAQSGKSRGMTDGSYIPKDYLTDLSFVREGIKDGKQRTALEEFFRYLKDDLGLVEADFLQNGLLDAFRTSRSKSRWLYEIRDRMHLDAKFDIVELNKIFKTMFEAGVEIPRFYDISAEAGPPKYRYELYSDPGVKVKEVDLDAFKSYLETLGERSIEYRDWLRKSHVENFNKVEFQFDYTVLHAAAESGQYHHVQDLVKVHRLKVDARSSTGQTPLMLAAFAGRLQTVQMLLKLGADAKAKDHKGKTAVDYVDDGWTDARNSPRDDIWSKSEDWARSQTFNEIADLLEAGSLHSAN